MIPANDGEGGSETWYNKKKQEQRRVSNEIP